jgi:hypothetical protein
MECPHLPEKTQRMVDDVIKHFKSKERQGEVEEMLDRVTEISLHLRDNVKLFFKNKIPNRDEFFALVTLLYHDEFRKFDKDELVTLCAFMLTATAWDSIEHGAI